MLLNPTIDHKAARLETLPAAIGRRYLSPHQSIEEFHPSFFFVYSAELQMTHLSLLQRDAAEAADTFATLFNVNRNQKEKGFQSLNTEKKESRNKIQPKKCSCWCVCNTFGGSLTFSFCVCAFVPYKEATHPPLPPPPATHTHYPAV